MTAWFQTHHENKHAHCSTCTVRPALYLLYTFCMPIPVNPSLCTHVAHTLWHEHPCVCSFCGACALACASFSRGTFAPAYLYAFFVFVARAPLHDMSFLLVAHAPLHVSDFRCHMHPCMCLIFGGTCAPARGCRYSSAAGGHLNELWVFSMDLMEWLQPDTTGKQ